MFLAIAAVVAAIDQLTKHLVSAAMELGESIQLIEGYLWLTSVRNTGAAYNILKDHARLLSFVSVIVLAALIIFMLISGKKLSRGERIAFGLIIGGGFGNLIDRHFLGYVVDFIDIKIIPVFNIADAAITTGCALLLLNMLVIIPLKEKRRKISEEKAIKAEAVRAAKQAEEERLAAEKAAEETRKAAEAEIKAAAEKEAGEAESGVEEPEKSEPIKQAPKPGPANPFEAPDFDSADYASDHSGPDCKN